MTTATTCPSFEARFSDLAELRRVRDAELLHGGFFLRGADSLRERERCLLVLVHPAGRRLELEAEAVLITEQGAGLQLLSFDESLKRQLEDFVASGESVERSQRETNPYLRLRNLPVAEQLRRARTGELQERVALERIYGKSVWEALLSNPRLSIVEVSSLARKGTLPQPLIDAIAGNEAWLTSGELRRALLSNPRLRGHALTRVLGALSLAELKLVEQMSAHPPHVREEARRRLKR